MDHRAGGYLTGMSHRTAELRSLELHRMVADRIVLDATIVERAVARVRGWVAGGTVHEAYATAWLDALEGSRADLLTLLVDDSVRAADLRQVTPFAGVISDRDRQDIIRRIGRHAS
ncbi:MAG: hypothetical protein H7287_14015 [Thermoleophilia bacterium]|nr:hypothetical protein [Thermoleophilia bacterium]